jgi:A/G-specific adenine glycosylase
MLCWYDEAGRDLPWRVLPKARQGGQKPDAYAVWLSEIMLQQTQVVTVRSYHAAFLARWPNLQALANAPLDEVLSLWAGLGYYARARNLHACACAVMEDHGGQFPATEAQLRTLPGVGDYTAAAMVAILYETPSNVVDGNIERVMARLHRLETPLPAAKGPLNALAAHYVAPDRAADWPQALMDLGAVICRPKNSDCSACPLSGFCAGYKVGDALSFPRRSPKKVKPVRFGAAFVLQKGDTVWLRRRPAKGLLGAMSEVPGTEWLEQPRSVMALLADAPQKAKWRKAGLVTHVFTHFTLKLETYQAEASSDFSSNNGWWAKLDALDRQALPSVMRKVLALGLKPPT